VSKISAITKDHCAGKTWRLTNGHSFAKQDAVAMLVVGELSTALMSYPLGFISGAKGYQLVGIQGFDMGVNLQVAPNGKWLGTYLPKAYRSQPFLLVSTSDGNKALCIDESIAVIDDRGGEAFYGDDGELSPKLAETLKNLVDFEKERATTDLICSQLNEFSLIEPWDITVNKGKEQNKIQGLFRINEAKLNQLDGTQLERLRNVGGLVVAYCQLLSMQNLPKLGRLYQERQRAQSDAIEGLQAFGLSTQNDVLSFENL
jgi:hypothetical protein